MKIKLSSPWNTKKYSFNNSSTNRTLKGDLGIFPSKRMSQGAMISPARGNVKEGSFAFGAQVQSGRSVTVRPENKNKNVQSTQSGLAQAPTNDTTFRTNIGMQSLISGDIGSRKMTPKTRQREVNRITSNLPEVYNRYFMTMGPEDKLKLSNASPSDIDIKGGFSLNKTQKDSIRAGDNINLFAG